MSLIPFDPWRSLHSLQQEIERFFAQASHQFSGGFTSSYGPQRVQVLESEQEVVVHVELRGIEKKEDVQLELHAGHLLLKGSSQSMMENTQQQMHQYSSIAQSFQRIVPLPANVRRDGMTTAYQDGILTIRLPKR